MQYSPQWMRKPHFQSIQRSTVCLPGMAVIRVHAAIGGEAFLKVLFLGGRGRFALAHG